MELKSSDLHIGNWVNDLLGYPTKVRGVTIGGIWIHGYPFIESQLTPIHLTPEILVKAGFEKDGDGDVIWYQKDMPVIGQICTSSKGNYLFDTETDTLRIYYVHQLQNLYHILSGGKELEIFL